MIMLCAAKLGNEMILLKNGWNWAGRARRSDESCDSAQNMTHVLGPYLNPVQTGVEFEAVAAGS